MVSASIPPTTPPAMGPALGEPPAWVAGELLVEGPDPATGVMLYMGEKVLAKSDLALATHWHGNTEKFLRS